MSGKLSFSSVKVTANYSGDCITEAPLFLFFQVTGGFCNLMDILYVFGVVRNSNTKSLFRTYR
ncbi:hypothetical protein, partial [Paenibacillus sp. FSL H7-0331]|uniref:hypothetical protein n=1 Tax=Paenibacillus sp. FSL H7-0331 TaxID=1920421 RepID=UPI001C4BA23E